MADQEEKKWKKAIVVIEADPEEIEKLKQENFLKGVEILFSLILDPAKARVRNVYPLNQ